MTMQNLRSCYRANRAQNELLSAFEVFHSVIWETMGFYVIYAEVQMNTHQKWL